MLALAPPLALALPGGFSARRLRRARAPAREPSRVVRHVSAGDAPEGTTTRDGAAFAASAASRRRAPASIAALAAAILANASPAFSASDATTISEFNASGILFKDSVEVVALADPLVDGVTVYLSDFKRSVSAKLSSGDIFSEPSQTSLACVRDDSRPGGVQITGDLGGREGKEMFAERKNMNLLNNKVLRIRRVYDAPRNTLVYVSYSTRTSSADAEGPSAGQYKTSVCAVPLKPGEGPNAPEAK